MKRAYVFFNGELIGSKDYYKELFKKHPGDFYCADGGARHMEELGIYPLEIWGDLDSVPEELLEKYRSKDVVIKKFSRDKDFTDGELILNHISSLDYEKIVVIGGLGGRKDHELSNINLLFLFDKLYFLSEKEEVFDYYQVASRKVGELRVQSMRLRTLINKWGEDLDDARVDYSAIISKYNTKDEAISDYNKMRSEMEEWMKLCEKLDAIRKQNKNFNKSVCFSNIRELLKDNQDVKIGKIEKEAGIRLGYMSRLEKGDNSADPSMEFIVTAAKMLNVSIDALISVDIGGLTTTEKFLFNFFEKLKTDTIADKLTWNVETEFDLERYETDYNGNSMHPLFSLETFYRESECGYPDQVTENVYVSKTFGPNTGIHGDCFNLRLKNGTFLYLMDLVKDVHRTSDKTAFVKEAVMYVPSSGIQVIATTHDDYPIVELLEDLYSVVKEYMKHPQVNNDVMSAINAFMKDDFEDDPDYLPF